MKSIYVLASVLFGLSFSSFSQAQSDTIETKKLSQGRIAYYQHGSYIKSNKLPKLLKTSDLARPTVRASQGHEVVGAVFAGAGAGLIGGSVGAYIGGANMDWTVFGIGAGLAAVSIPFNLKKNQLKRKAIAQFNSERSSAKLKQRSALNMSVSNDGIGLVWKF